MSTFTHASFRENDIQLLQTGNFADGIVKCKGRTWKVHRMLLASRLRFFKAAFYGQFVEASTGEVDFPESDPDMVDIMIRHLYRADIDVRDLKTPALCIHCWRLADYLQLESLKVVAISSLGQHLDAMALLATSNHFDMSRKMPNWLNCFLHALREACRDESTKPLHAIFATFLWVTRFDFLVFSKPLRCLEDCHGVNKKLMMLLVFQTVNGSNNDDDWPDWVGSRFWRQQIAEKSAIHYHAGDSCDECKHLFEENELEFHNPFPVNDCSIGGLKWCKRCIDKFNEGRCWPWRSGGGIDGDTVKLDAWTWS